MVFSVYIGFDCFFGPDMEVGKGIVRMNWEKFSTEQGGYPQF